MIVAGGGVIRSGAQRELVELAEKLSIPVATSLNAKAAIVDDHPLAVGVPGAYSRDCANRALAEADLVFFIGSRAGGQVTNNWMFPPSGTKVIQLDIDPQELGRNYPNAVSILGDAKASLRRLIEAAPARTAAGGWPQRVRQLIAEWRDEHEPTRHSDATPIRPERICKEISDVLPPDGVVVSDTGHAGIWTAGMVDLKHPGQSYFRTAGSLGWGFPAALGVKCALPGPAGGLLHRRRRLLLSHRRARDRAPPQHQRGDRRQQQLVAQPGDPAQRRGLWRQAARPRRGDVAVSRRRFHQGGGRRSAAPASG